MASIKLKGDTSGEITIDVPAVAGTNTLTLPASTGTLLTSDGDGSSLTGVGKVLQVVSSQFTAQASSTSTSYTSTGLSLAITPSATSSKILVIAHLSWGAGSWHSIALNSSVSSIIAETEGRDSYDWNPRLWNGSLMALDSPSTTSATTYSIYYKASASGGTGGTVYINRNGDNNNDGTCSITLIEVAG